MNRHAALCTFLVAVFAAWSAQAAVVSRLKTETVPLTDDQGRVVDFKRADFKSPWNVKGRNPDGSISVDVDGKAYSVPPMYVEMQGTSENAVQPSCLDNRDTRLAATRNVGDGCKKK